jgi:hypothetical protein
VAIAKAFRRKTLLSKNNFPEELLEMSIEEILERILNCLQPLNEEEIKATIATGHKVVLVESDQFAMARHYVQSILDGLNELEET